METGNEKGKTRTKQSFQKMLKLMGHSDLNVLQVGCQEEHWEELSLTMRKMADTQ